jgi:alpha-glucosidase
MTRTEPTATAPETLQLADPRWWREAVVYQVYVRSFADANGDGIGDLAGVRERLPYLRELGVDALWFNPWYPSPLADSGYDIADYRSIDPVFGTLAEAEQLIGEARARGLGTRGRIKN